MSQVKTDSITEHTSGAGTAFTTKVMMAVSNAVDTIKEYTAGAGVTISNLIHATAGINFGAQTLSAYEENVWTPVLGGTTTDGAYTYTNQHGTYRRIGDLVFVKAYISISAIGTAATGSLVVRGLPFTSDASVGGYSSLFLGEVDRVTLSAGYTQFASNIAPNTNYALLLMLGSNVSASGLPPANLSTTSAIVLVGMYTLKP